jgi:hypothetical protein
MIIVAQGTQEPFDVSCNCQWSIVVACDTGTLVVACDTGTLVVACDTQWPLALAD